MQERKTIFANILIFLAVFGIIFYGGCQLVVTFAESIEESPRRAALEQIVRQ